jgi:hypothetical protein
MRKGSIVTPWPKTDIITFSEREEFKTASNLNIGCGLSLNYILYPFLLYTNLGKV